jgi:hypothetical protein
MSILSSLFATPQAIDKTVDAVINTGDKLWITEEERIEFAQKKREWYLKYLESTQSQNVSRRLIAVIVTALWSALIVTGVIAKSLGSVEVSTFIFDTLKDNVNLPFSIIIGFYFAAHVANKIRK